MLQHYFVNCLYSGRNIPVVHGHRDLLQPFVLYSKITTKNFDRKESYDIYEAYIRYGCLPSLLEVVSHLLHVYFFLLYCLSQVFRLYNLIPLWLSKSGISHTDSFQNLLR